MKCSIYFVDSQTFKAQSQKHYLQPCYYICILNNLSFTSKAQGLGFFILFGKADTDIYFHKEALISPFHLLEILLIPFSFALYSSKQKQRL